MQRRLFRTLMGIEYDLAYLSFIDWLGFAKCFAETIGLRETACGTGKKSAHLRESEDHFKEFQCQKWGTAGKMGEASRMPFVR